jgi:hypothetical protein
VYFIRENFQTTPKMQVSFENEAPEGKFLATKFEFKGCFGMSLEGDCHEVKVTPNLELLITFDVSLEGVCHELYS